MSATEQKGNGWRIWRAPGQPSTFSVWGLQGNIAAHANWHLTFDFYPNEGGFRVLGEAHVTGDYGVDTYFTATPRVSIVQMREMLNANSFRFPGRVWRGGSSPEYDDTLLIHLHSEQVRAMTIWLDEVEEKGGLSGLGGLGHTPSVHAGIANNLANGISARQLATRELIDEGACEPAFNSLMEDITEASAFTENAHASDNVELQERAVRFGEELDELASRFRHKCLVRRK